MSASFETSVFKSGNSAALRLPRHFGFKPGDTVRIDKNGGKLEIERTVDPGSERAKILEMLRRLDEIGPVPLGDREAERIEFPDRPGLY